MCERSGAGNICAGTPLGEHEGRDWPTRAACASSYSFTMSAETVALKKNPVILLNTTATLFCNKTCQTFPPVPGEGMNV